MVLHRSVSRRRDHRNAPTRKRNTWPSHPRQPWVTSAPRSSGDCAISRNGLPVGVYLAIKSRAPGFMVPARGQAPKRRRHGMALTSPPRTVLDFAALIGDDYDVRGTRGRGQVPRGWASEGELKEQVERNPGKRGVPRLRRVRSRLPGGPRRTRSEARASLSTAFARERRSTATKRTTKAFGPELDFVWEDLR